MALIEPVSEKAFKPAAKRLLRVLKEQNPTADPSPTLAQAQETLCKMMGWGSYHALQQTWRRSPASLPKVVLKPSVPLREMDFVDAILAEFDMAELNMAEKAGELSLDWPSNDEIPASAEVIYSHATLLPEMDTEMDFVETILASFGLTKEGDEQTEVSRCTTAPCERAPLKMDQPPINIVSPVGCGTLTRPPEPLMSDAFVPGYHLRPITKGTLGEPSKIREELDEYEEAMEQGVIIMALVELSDVYGAMEALVAKHLPQVDLAEMVARYPGISRSLPEFNPPPELRPALDHLERVMGHPEEATVALGELCKALSITVANLFHPLLLGVEDLARMAAVTRRAFANGRRT